MALAYINDEMKSNPILSPSCLAQRFRIGDWRPLAERGGK